MGALPDVVGSKFMGLPTTLRDDGVEFVSEMVSLEFEDSVPVLLTRVPGGDVPCSVSSSKPSCLEPPYSAGTKDRRGKQSFSIPYSC